MKIIRITLFSLLALTLIYCSSSKSAQSTLEGTVNYREKMLLPPNAIVVVKLVDASKQDVASKTLSIDTLKAQAPPMTYSLNYNAKSIEKGRSYQVQAAVYVDGQLRMINTLATPANLSEKKPVEIMVSSIHNEAVDPPRKMIDFYAQGNEPFWSLYMVIGMGMELRQMNSDIVISVPFPQRTIDPKTRDLVLKSVTEAHTLEVRIAEENCQDTMADESYEFAVTVILDGGTPMRGCGYLVGRAKSLRLDYELSSAEGIDLSTAPKTPELSIDLLRGTYNATDGCNGLGGDLYDRGDALLFKPGFSTEMYCGNDFDRSFQELFLDVEGFRFDNMGNLYLRIEDQDVLTYSVKKEEVSKQVISDLHDIFVVIEIKGVPVAKDQENPRFEFYPAEGRVSGYTGCNQFNGSIEIGEETLRFAPQMAMTKKLCQNSVEMDFTTALAEVTSYHREGTQLFLTNSKGSPIYVLQKSD